MAKNDVLVVEVSREALEVIIERLNEAKLTRNGYVATFKYDEYVPGKAMIISEEELVREP